MKKILLASAAATLTLALVGCGEDAISENEFRTAIQNEDHAFLQEHVQACESEISEQIGNPDRLNEQQLRDGKDKLSGTCENFITVMLDSM